MPDKIYVDASFFIATQIINHPFHQESLRILKEYSESDLYFSLLTIDEIVYTLDKYKIDQNKIISVIREKIILIRNTKLLSYKDNVGQIENYLEVWRKTQLRPRDALHLYLMREAALENIATFDKDFIKNRKRLGIRVL